MKFVALYQLMPMVSSIAEVVIPSVGIALLVLAN